MFCTIFLFDESFLQVVSITFSSLIVTELLNTLSNVNQFWRLSLWFCIGFSLAMYTGVILIIPQYVNINAFDKNFLINVLITVSVSWGPYFIIDRLVKCITPSEIERVSEGIDEHRKRSTFMNSQHKDSDDFLKN